MKRTYASKSRAVGDQPRAGQVFRDAARRLTRLDDELTRLVLGARRLVELDPVSLEIGAQQHVAAACGEQQTGAAQEKDCRLEQVQRIARWQRVTADELTTRTLSSYLDRLEWEKLEAEMVAFQAQLPVLLAAYADQYVAMHEGGVIDHDTDLRTLHGRVYAKMGAVPILLQKVTSAPTPDILVRSPRLEA